ncbi:5200_t:CDS:2 [Diversispora eburnea]|uniref:thioredoxin-dependent peroxiredoxin n=1 Tax=Diversispora eburnea TaxID=1213867 RepID=A0A9N8YXY8_9GLOM|nr:5200_t:CDS:2 [Diversispora eburnea]
MHSLKDKPFPKGITLKNQDNEDVNLDSVIGNGKPSVVFFYPRDETYGCTQEVCHFRDSYSTFSEAGATVLGISSDSPESHKNFIAKQNLPFQLLSDSKGEARKAFVVQQFMGLVSGRVTYLINRDGIIADVFNSQLNFSGHAKRAVEFIQSQVASEDK